MAQVKYDDTRREFVLEDGSVIENLKVTNWSMHKDSVPIYEFGSSTPVDDVGMTYTTITVDYEEPEGYSLKKDIDGWKTEVDREEIRKKSEEIVNDFKRK